MTHKDLNIYGDSYVANTSSVDGKSAHLGEKPSHDHIEYFQSFARFREPGLPTKLPARLMRNLDEDSEYRNLKEQIRCLQEDITQKSAVKSLRIQLQRHKSSLAQQRLEQYRAEWLQQTKQCKILQNEKYATTSVTDDGSLDPMSLVHPARRRLNQVMVDEVDVSSDVRWQAVQDLYSMLSEDHTVIYLPGERPINGCCPIKHCNLDLSR